MSLDSDLRRLADEYAYRESERARERSEQRYVDALSPDARAAHHARRAADISATNAVLGVLLLGALGYIGYEKLWPGIRAHLAFVAADFQATLAVSGPWGIGVAAGWLALTLGLAVGGQRAFLRFRDDLQRPSRRARRLTTLLLAPPGFVAAHWCLSHLILPMLRQVLG